MEINESFGKVENLLNKIPLLEKEFSTNSDNTAQLYYDYTIKRNIVTYDKFNDYVRIDQIKIPNS